MSLRLQGVNVTKLRFIGDVHGKYDDYFFHANNAPDDFSIQLGDLGFNYSVLNRLDSERHKVLAGNHDNYDCMNTPHWLGDYGLHASPIGPIFFIRGGYSIDHELRVENRNWWREEELSFAKLTNCVDVYGDCKADIVISHEAPSSIIKLVLPPGYWNGKEIGPSMTSQALNVMYMIHKPKLWLFGHHHRRIDETIEGVRFICLEELGTLDLEGA